ncbi:unnamed protein product [Clonostachys rhizophaga]|uniref:Uncharacterized protein n=1 Tax=Clonostachys rhizophaga TaxID=160324 RepID=A0A9N9V1R8_9HYPO|nr:unnamed protein product [Clonostachys rhizophaga]
MSRDTYTPIFSSPLNPSSSSEDGQAKRTKPTPNPASTRCKRMPSPSQRLMRKKAAEAWKSEALQRQVAEYERQTLEALSAKSPSPARPLAHKPKGLRDAQEGDKPRRKSLTEQLPFLQGLSLGVMMPDRWNRPVNPIWIFSPKKTK